jgi:hypothetical protein
MSLFSLAAGVLSVMYMACGLGDARPLNVRDSSPKAEATVDGRKAQYVIRFDGWVDHGASQVDITENGKVIEPLVPTRDSEPDVSPPRPLHWLQADTGSIGMRNRFSTAISRMGSFRSQSRGDI